TPPPPTAAASPAAPAPPPAPHVATSCPGNPDALGVSRVVEIDTTGGPGFGFEHFKAHDFLREGEIVLTFDDGPWPKNTPAVLAALAAHCTKAIFFPIGLHAHVRAWHTQAGGCGRTCGRLAYLVSPGFVEDKGALPDQRQDGNRGVRPQGRDREGHQRCALGSWRADCALLPLPGVAATAGTDRLSRQAQYCDFLRRPRLLRLQDAQTRAGATVRDGQAEEAWQRHCADA